MMTRLFKDDASVTPRQVVVILMTLATLTWLITVLIAAVFQINRYVGDVPAYWGYSQALNEFNVYHMPLYPVILAPFHLVVPPEFNPIGLMSILGGLAWLGGVIAVYFVLRELHAGFAGIAAFLFGVYPIIGLGYALVPTSDIIGRMLLILALLAYLKNRTWLTVLLLALILLTHKVLWLNVLIFALVALYQRRLSIIQLIVSGLPLAGYAVLGAAYHGSLTWMLSGSLEHTRIETDKKTIFPIFDTILGRFANGGTINYVVGGLVLLLFILAIFLLISRVWQSQPVLLALIIPTLVVGTVMAAASSMVVIRFSIFLFIPLWLYLFPAAGPRWKILSHPAVLTIIALICIATQILQLFYLTVYFA